MCGITGAIERINTSKLNFKHSSDLHNYISNRGPDHYGFDSVEINTWKASFGHTRLSILDLTLGSNQPMHSDCGRYLIVYNGEIYNYLEIRSELISKSYSFNTLGDTEVLLKSWQEWGESCLNKLNGMFAFAIYDNLENNLYLVRDRFGVKPLLYGFFDDGQLFFSSSIKAVASVVGDEINLEYCSRGLRYGFFEGGDCFSPFQNVKYVPSGSFVKFSIAEDLSHKIVKWYCLKTEVEKKVIELQNSSESLLFEMCKYLIQDSTRIRMRSDVPLAVSLSGGLDSTTIASLLKREVSSLTGFCYGSPNQNHSEGPLVQKFVNEKSIKINFIHPSYSESELGDLFDKTLKAQEAPFLGMSILAQHEVYKNVQKQGFKVLLGGQGGDEVFAGYRKFFLIALTNAFKKNQLLHSVKLLYSTGLMLINELNNINLYWEERNRFFKKNGKEITYFENFPISSHEMGFGKSMQERQILDIEKFSLPSLLRYEDRNSMFFSIESRLPFMDFRVVEYGVALNDLLKIRNGYGKWILRDAMNNIVPNYILKNRAKRGFDVTQSWVKDGVGRRLINNVLDNKSIVSNYINDIGSFERNLKVEKLSSNKHLLNELMLLNFLIKTKKE